MVCFINSDHVRFSREFAFCPFINYAYLFTWMHAHRTKLERDSSLKYHHLNGETKHSSWKGQLLSWVVTSNSANRIRHHAPFIVTSIISVSLVTELISDRSKHALRSKVNSCSFFTDSYPKSLTIFISSGKSSDNEGKLEPISLGDRPVPCPKKTSAVDAEMRLCGLLMSLLPVRQLLLND